MWSDTAEGKQLVQELSRQVVSETAPEELDLFDEMLQDYFVSPQPPAPSTVAGDDQLGFGIAGLLVAATPAAAAMVGAVLNFLVAEVVKAAKDESSTLIKQKIQALFSTQKSGPGSSAGKTHPEVPPLTPDQLKKVRQLAQQQAQKFGIDAAQAANMANALVGSLATAK